MDDNLKTSPLMFLALVFFSGSFYAMLHYGNKLLFLPVAGWFGVFLFTIFFSESREEQDSGEIPQQQSNLGDDSTKPTERQTAPDEVAVRKQPEKLDEAPELPFEQCTSEMGCRCCFAPAVS